MADMIKNLREQYPELSIAEILDIARENMMKDRIAQVIACDIETLIKLLKLWDLTEDEVTTLLANTSFTALDLLMYVLREQPPKPQRRSWLSCLDSSNTSETDQQRPE